MKTCSARTRSPRPTGISPIRIGARGRWNWKFVRSRRSSRSHSFRGSSPSYVVAEQLLHFAAATGTPRPATTTPAGTCLVRLLCRGYLPGTKSSVVEDLEELFIPGPRGVFPDRLEPNFDARGNRE